MAKAMKLKSDGRTITVRVPISIRKRGGRRLVLAPDGTEQDLHERYGQQIDSVMVKAIARAFRWTDMLEREVYSSFKEIAAAEHIHHSYIARLSRMRSLAPDVIEAVLDGSLCSEVTLQNLSDIANRTWEDQRLAVLDKTRFAS